MSMDPKVTGVRSVELNVRDLAASLDYYTRHWGLTEVDRREDRAVLRGTDTEHHVVELRQSPRAGIARIAFAAPDVATVNALHARVSGFGARVLSAPSAVDGFLGGGHGFELMTPDGVTLRISAETARHHAGPVDPAKPVRINHVVLNTSDLEAQQRFFCDLLGFRFSDSIGHMSFIRCSANHHSIALAKADGASLNHVAFDLANFDTLMQGVGRMRLASHEPGWGVGRHAAPGHNIFAYFVDPNGFAVELTTEVDQVDDTYVARYADYWGTLPLRPCAWAGQKMLPSKQMIEAMSGRLAQGAQR
ncbi:VOC family protein [Roseiarcaceae bacterium H3SJ34-1]|uniref:VOC family protein n=1 Tax=Terripilifer ovatus TaxID=3032367 RepID=UPI003AB96021|nr:VOC family protein [Roseiarcaceae bacterium H3SJ34-1]